MYINIILIYILIITNSNCIKLKFNNKYICNDTNVINILTCIDKESICCLKKYNNSIISDNNISYVNKNFIAKYPIFCYNNIIYFIKNSAIYNIYNKTIKLFNLTNEYKLSTNNIALINYNNYSFDIRYKSGLYIKYDYIIPFIKYLTKRTRFENLKLKKSILNNMIYINGSILLNNKPIVNNKKYTYIILIMCMPLIILIIALIFFHICVLILQFSSQ
ncbi:hypothetical protein AMV159 [Betaentomopoxvirus amoorei]|uniref:AMV159 n=1 Tax=Amsacta moorei entomopoxvirus TaxID=28321 RepID=Q9EMP0_AMEPV|nr:hypothetical protein AMV159 [Amsacta moorei entomopoxvirus]AAG02865.1 AMV159 [Amsacta moorei entomopoxvirus]